MRIFLYFKIKFSLNLFLLQKISTQAEDFLNLHFRFFVKPPESRKNLENIKRKKRIDFFRGFIGNKVSMSNHSPLNLLITL